jgi:hypothetical protein
MIMGSKKRMTKLKSHCVAAWRPPPIVRKLSEWISVQISQTPAICGFVSDCTWAGGGVSEGERERIRGE